MPICEIVGSKPERVFVLIHGSPSSSKVWLPVVEQVAPHATLALFDILDHGDQPDAPDVTMADCLTDLVDAVQGLNHSSVTLVGHSLGAYMAARACPGLGPKVERLVLISGLAALPSDQAQARLELAEALESGALDRNAVVDILKPWMLGEPPQPPGLEALLMETWAEITAERLARAGRRVATLAEPQARVERIDVPAVALHEFGDQAVSLDLGRELAGICSNGELVVLKGDSHMTPVTHADAVVQHMLGGA